MPSLSAPDPPLTDGQIALRPFRLDDVAIVTQACQDPELSRWMATIPYPYTEEDAKSWIATHEDMWRRGEEAHLAMTTSSNGFLGAIGLQPDWERRSSMVGYWVAAWARRQGVATRALRLVSQWTFDVVGLETLNLNTKLGNVASEGVAQKAGFEIIGLDEEFEHSSATGERFQVKHWRLRAATLGQADG